MVHETFLITRFLEKFHIPEWFLKVLENSGTVTVGYDHLIIYRGVSEGGGGQGGQNRVRNQRWLCAALHTIYVFALLLAPQFLEVTNNPAGNALGSA